MSESVENHAVATPGLDLPAVLEWLDRHAPGTIGLDARAQLIAGGRSNLTYLLDDGTHQIVLRRPPLGHVLATAHDMSREYRIISALADTAVPVPQAHALCTDLAVNEVPFYAMSFVQGLIIRSDTGTDGPELDTAARSRVAAVMMTTLADLHGIDAAAVGLADFGRPEGFMGRQLARWWKQLQASRSRELDGIEQLRDQLGARLPVNQGSGIVHGDYRLDNLLIAPPGSQDALSVRAVLDWEMATFGDPLSDLGLLMAYWDVLSALPGTAVSTVGPAQDYPDGATLTGWYAERRDADLRELPWYVAFGLFKLAVILEGIHYRYTLGQTLGGDFSTIGDAVPVLIGAGLSTLTA
jgi:aminoglycoside phosphotransferase (APT) family kinase protein